MNVRRDRIGGVSEAFDHAGGRSRWLAGAVWIGVSERELRVGGCMMGC